MSERMWPVASTVTDPNEMELITSCVPSRGLVRLTKTASITSPSKSVNIASPATKNTNDPPSTKVV